MVFVHTIKYWNLDSDSQNKTLLLRLPNSFCKYCGQISKGIYLKFDISNKIKRLFLYFWPYQANLFLCNLKAFKTCLKAIATKNYTNKHRCKTFKLK